MSFNYSPKVTTDSLVLYLDAANSKSYPGNGTVWTDLSRFGNPATLTNGPTFDGTNKNGTITFDGTDDFAQINNSTSLNPLTSITLCAWCNFNGVYSGYYAPIIFKRNNFVSYFEQYQLVYLTSGQIQVAIGDGSTNQAATSAAAYIDEIVNAVGVVDTTNSILKLYINGQLNSTTAISYPTMDVSTNSVIIGGNNEPGFLGSMGGNIYNVSIYNRVLSDVEIAQNYNAFKSRFGV